MSLKNFQFNYLMTLDALLPHWLNGDASVACLGTLKIRIIMFIIKKIIIIIIFIIIIICYGNDTHHCRVVFHYPKLSKCVCVCL